MLNRLLSQAINLSGDVVKELNDKTDSKVLGETIVGCSWLLMLAILLAVAIKFWYISLCAAYLVYTVDLKLKEEKTKQLGVAQERAYYIGKFVWVKFATPIMNKYQKELNLEEYSLSDFEVNDETLVDYPKLDYYFRVKKGSSTLDDDELTEYRLRIIQDLKKLILKHKKDYPKDWTEFLGVPRLSLDTFDQNGYVIKLSFLFFDNLSDVNLYKRRFSEIHEKDAKEFKMYNLEVVEEGI